MELSRSILTELQLDQPLGVQGLPRAGVHFVLLNEGQDVEQVEYMALPRERLTMFDPGEC